MENELIVIKQLPIIEEQLRTVGEARSLPRSTGFQLPTRMGEFVPVCHICTIQPNTQLTNLAGG